MRINSRKLLEPGHLVVRPSNSCANVPEVVSQHSVNGLVPGSSSSSGVTHRSCTLGLD